MTRLEAHGRLAGVPQAARIDLPVVVMVPVPDLDTWPLAAAALASLSGQLEDAQDPRELVESLLHGIALVSSEVVSLEAVQAEAFEIVAEVVAWGEAAERAVAGWN